MATNGQATCSRNFPSFRSALLGYGKLQSLTMGGTYAAAEPMIARAQAFASMFNQEVQVFAAGLNRFYRTFHNSREAGSIRHKCEWNFASCASLWPSLPACVPITRVPDGDTCAGSRSTFVATAFSSRTFSRRRSFVKKARFICRRQARFITCSRRQASVSALEKKGGYWPIPPLKSPAPLLSGRKHDASQQ